ncbi:hypothetical protein GCM10007989_02020 [Devosia pacifica]|uniref:Uncharacterized protein n=1 Tax=Devosia pacifica TaxID=1335967 RepID=A0A918RU81_9HYPH|nr:hypothetical protein [Devosia pacifica]GHA11313.1 hypothetical protein GCM10007989_02020 [Devosia pacifica]
MTLDTLAAIVAARLAVDRGAVDPHLSKVSAEATLIEQAAELILLTLADGCEDWRLWFDLPDSEGNVFTPLEILSAMLVWLADLRTNGLGKMAFESVVRVGDDAVVISRDDGKLLVYTEDGHHVPHLARRMTSARAVSGRCLFWIARDIEDHLPERPMEWRTPKIGTVNGVPIAQWREAIEGELEKMEAHL